VLAIYEIDRADGGTVLKIGHWEVQSVVCGEREAKQSCLFTSVVSESKLILEVD